MKEKIGWTLTGRKVRYLLNDDNTIAKELEDLGPLNDEEMEWVQSSPSLPFKEWKEQKDKEANGSNDATEKTIEEAGPIENHEDQTSC